MPATSGDFELTMDELWDFARYVTEAVLEVPADGKRQFRRKLGVIDGVRTLPGRHAAGVC